MYKLKGFIKDISILRKNTRQFRTRNLFEKILFRLIRILRDTTYVNEEELTALLNDFYILDVRRSEDYASGHIEGSVNTSLVNVLDAAAAADKPILVACYTGQSAGHAVAALRLSGYPDAKVLKFGIAGWNSDNMGPWSGNIGDAAVGHNAWNFTSVAENTLFNAPTFETNKLTGPEILAERVQFMLESGFLRIWPRLKKLFSSHPAHGFACPALVFFVGCGFTISVFLSLN